ncbi:MAG: translocation protein TolB, partial [Candidatus Rokuibacteriota bacterium]
SNRLGRWQVFAMLLDGSPPTQISQGPAEHTSPSWSPRLP